MHTGPDYLILSDLIAKPSLGTRDLPVGRWTHGADHTYPVSFLGLWLAGRDPRSQEERR
jgi:hypothetical protein